MMLYEDNDASLIRMLEAFLESAPQLILQLYIILTEGEEENVELLRKTLTMHNYCLTLSNIIHMHMIYKSIKINFEGITGTEYK